MESSRHYLPKIMHFRSEQSKLSNNLAMDQADPGTPAEQKAEAQESAKTLDDIIASLKQKDTTKVIVRFKATGNAPILKQNFYKITASHKFQTVIQFLRKELRYQGSDPLFLYINSAFAPAPDEIVGNLFKSFNTDGQLIINYCTTAAWG